MTSRCSAGGEQSRKGACWARAAAEMRGSQTPCSIAAAASLVSIEAGACLAQPCKAAAGTRALPFAAPRVLAPAGAAPAMPAAWDDSDDSSSSQQSTPATECASCCESSPAGSPLATEKVMMVRMGGHNSVRGAARCRAAAATASPPPPPHRRRRRSCPPSLCSRFGCAFTSPAASTPCVSHHALFRHLVCIASFLLSGVLRCRALGVPHVTHPLRSAPGGGEAAGLAGGG